MTKKFKKLKCSIIVLALIFSVAVMPTASAFTDTSQDSSAPSIYEEGIESSEDNTKDIDESTTNTEESAPVTEKDTPSENLKPKERAAMPSPTVQDETEFLIKDENLRKVINRRLGKTGSLVDTYSATDADLKTITSLNLYSTTNPMNNILKVDSMEGLELLTNLKTLDIMYSIIPESAFVTIAKLPNLTRLSINSVIFTGDNSHTTKKLNSQINDGPIEATMLIPFDNHINLSPLGNSPKLDYLYITLSGTQQDAAYSYSPRTHFDVSGLGGLTNLKHLTLGDFASVDDKSFDFLRNLTQLKELSLYSTPINNVESIATLNNLTSLNLNNTYVNDFTPIIDKPYFTNVSTLKSPVGTHYYTTETVDGETINKVTLHTNIKIVGEISNVSFSTINGFQGSFSVDEYRIEDGELVVELILKAPRSFNVYNWATGEWNKPHYGIVYGVSFKTSTNKTLSYTVNPINIGKTVVFDYNYEGGSTENRYFDPLSKIEEPEASDFNRLGYTLKGWYKDAEGTEPFDFNTDTTENTRLYAQWEKDAFVEPPTVEPPIIDGQLKEIEKCEPIISKLKETGSRGIVKAVPKTGDSSDITFYILILLGSIILTLPMIIKKSKKAKS